MVREDDVLLADRCGQAPKNLALHHAKKMSLKANGSPQTGPILFAIPESIFPSGKTILTALASESHQVREAPTEGLPSGTSSGKREKIVR